MWEITIQSQSTTFLLSLILGFTAFLVYETLSLIRRLTKPKTAIIYLLDILFFIILAFLFFCFFMLNTKGHIRGFVFVGAILGFIFFKCTIAQVFYSLDRPLLKICKFLKKYLKIVAKPLERFKKIVYNRASAKTTKTLKEDKN